MSYRLTQSRRPPMTSAQRRAITSACDCDRLPDQDCCTCCKPGNPCCDDNGVAMMNRSRAMRSGGTMRALGSSWSSFTKAVGIGTRAQRRRTDVRRLRSQQLSGLGDALADAIASGVPRDPTTGTFIFPDGVAVPIWCQDGKHSPPGGTVPCMRASQVIAPAVAPPSRLPLFIALGVAGAAALWIVHKRKQA